jgi:hypothetical protein
MQRQFQPSFKLAAAAMVGANTDVLRLGYKSDAQKRVPPLTRHAIWQNHPNSGALAKVAFGFDATTMKLGDVFDDG